MSESDATQLAFDMGLYGSTLATHGYRAFNVFSNAASELLFADEDLDPCSPQSQQTVSTQLQCPLKHSPPRTPLHISTTLSFHVFRIPLQAFTITVHPA